MRPGRRWLRGEASDERYEGLQRGLAGRPRIIFAEAEHSTRTFDRVIFALGGTTPTNFLHTLGIAFYAVGPVFDEAGATNVAGLYLIGDLVVAGKVDQSSRRLIPRCGP